MAYLLAGGSWLVCDNLNLFVRDIQEKIMDNIIEEWRQIPDFSGYEISNLGRVRSIRHSLFGSPKLLSPAKNQGGYIFVNLYKDSKRHVFKIHRLVAITFIGLPTLLNSIVHHKDGDKTNNKLNNLEWSNTSANIMASDITNGRKLNINDVKEIRKLADSGITQRAIAKMFNVRPQAISKIILRQIWRYV